MPESKPKRPTPKKCPSELRERAVRLAREAHRIASGFLTLASELSDCVRAKR